MSSAVSRPTTTSTSFITGTGEKKCSPITRSGLRVHAASSAIGIEDVLEARKRASGSASSRRWKSLPLTRGSSVTASSTASTPGEVVELGGVGDPAAQLLSILAR